VLGHLVQRVGDDHHHRPRGRCRDLPRDVADHARFRFHHTGRYNVLQKFAYAGVLFVLLPLMILAAGPLNELRSILTGWTRIDPEKVPHAR
jgi:thiosulfate reductase cytochrome b subunit